MSNVNCFRVAASSNNRVNSDSQKLRRIAPQPLAAGYAKRWAWNKEMSISNKTRKVLWGRSGNRCVICKNELVIDATEKDDESVVAEECHIISSRPNGPRHDPSYALDTLDSYDNLILLCRTHHKMVDDQIDTFTTDILRQMKSKHEVWVSQKLSENKEMKPIQLRRVKQNIPAFLSRLTSGKAVLDLVINAMAYSFDHEELNSQEEVNLVSSFLQAAQEWGELGDDLETGDIVQIGFRLTESLRELEDADFLVFGGQEVQVLEGGLQPEPSNWPVAILKVIRKNNREIIKINSDKINEKVPNKANAADAKSRAAD